MRYSYTFKGVGFMKKIELSYYENQLILYSKGHFEREETYQDLKKMTSEAYGLPLDFTEQRNVYHFILNTYFKLLEVGYMKTSIKDFLFSLYKYQSDTISCVEMMKKMLSEMGLIEVQDIDLGIADPTILPKRKKPVFEIRIVRLEEDDDSFIVFGEQGKVHAYMEQIYKIQEGDILSEVPTEYPSTEKMYSDLDIVREDNPSFELYDAHAYVVN